ncbi:MAG TPA: metalloregulator ArsR/SmtB family transcription factor [Gemmatimonadaceae bacterium]|nr:metalloregulator ArsR/SmtB family transcription factor [Gemmatimonadaceae bacterium]
MTRRAPRLILYHMVYNHPSVLDRTFNALADPTRRALIGRLTAGERTISELAARFDMTLPAVSKHIRVLQRAGLADVRRDGRVRRTTLVAAPMREAAEWIEQYRRFWDFQFDQLAAYLASTTESDSKEASAWQHKPKRSKSSKSGERSARRATGSSARGRNRKS